MTARMTAAERAENAAAALTHSAALGGWDDAANQPIAPFCKAFGVSKNGTDIIVRMTPEQALRFADMIAEECD